MNYRHAFHAGNFADVVKHIILTRVLLYMQRKDGGIAMIDTHAGIGRYDLDADEAKRTGEAQDGVFAFLEASANAPAPIAELIAPYTQIIERFNPNDTLQAYPGSPRIMHALRRPQDRLALIELHKGDHTTLAQEFAGAHGVKTFNLDGWLALKSQLPPKEKRGLILIDPPYEVRDEFDRVMTGIENALKRFATGTYCIWYPLKHRDAVQRFEDQMQALEVKTLLCQLHIGPSEDQDGKPLFSGTGMAIINPPYVLADELETILPWLTQVLEISPNKGRWRITKSES